jgi:hypothetical protein
MFRGEADGRTRFGALVLEKGSALDPGPGFPDQVRAVVRRATDPEPADRYPSMRAFGDALEHLLTRAQRADLDRRLGRSAGDGTARWKWALALVVVLGFLSAFVLGGTVAALLILLFLVR